MVRYTEWKSYNSYRTLLCRQAGASGDNLFDSLDVALGGLTSGLLSCVTRTSNDTCNYWDEQQNPKQLNLIKTNYTRYTNYLLTYLLIKSQFIRLLQRQPTNTEFILSENCLGGGGRTGYAWMVNTFVKGQIPMTRSPILPKFFTPITHFQW